MVVARRVEILQLEKIVQQQNTLIASSSRKIFRYPAIAHIKFIVPRHHFIASLSPEGDVVILVENHFLKLFSFLFLRHLCALSWRFCKGSRRILFFLLQLSNKTKKKIVFFIINAFLIKFTFFCDLYFCIFSFHFSGHKCIV